MRLVEGYHFVAVLDQMVTGIAGGDQKMAAVFVGDEHLDDLMRIRCNRGVLEEQKLTRST